MKKDILNIKRFGNLFAADFLNGLSNFGLSALVCALSGVSCFAIVGLFGLIAGEGWTCLPTSLRGAIFAIMMVVVLLVGPSKLYGKLTDKKAGSFFLSIPASSFEKHASMIINSSIVFPLMAATAYLVIDTLLCLIFPDCGKSLIATAGTMVADIINFFGNDIPEEIGGIAGLFNPFIYIDDMIGTGMTFLLGALCFKKSKVAKTILVIIAFSMAMSSIMSPIMLSISGGSVELLTNKIGWLLNHAVLIDAINDTLFNCALATAIYFKVKTLKF